MAVPVNGEYEMFGTGSEASIEGAINSHDSTSGIDDFSSLINTSLLSYFDPKYAGDINSLTDVNSSLQYRNYPILPVPEECPEFSFTEVFDPGEVTLTFEIYSLDGNSTGVLNNGSTYNTTLTYNLEIGTPITITALNFSTGTSFEGWSTYQDASGVFESNTSLTSTAASDSTYYALIQQGNFISQSYCYTTSDNLNDICLTCNNPTTVYFDKSIYATNTAEGSIWYSDANLNSTSSNGYYYLSGSANPIVYNVVDGIVTRYTTCEDNLIYCSGEGSNSRWVIVSGNCYDYTIAAQSGATVTFTYTDCITGAKINTTLPASGSEDICAREQDNSEISQSPPLGAIYKWSTCGTFGPT